MMLLRGYLFVSLFIVGSCARRKGRCRDDMLTIADGKYLCSMLTDQHHWQQGTLGAYDNRVQLCSKPRYSGCCRTCIRNNLVRKQRQTKHRSSPTIPGKPDQQLPTVNCKDDRLYIADGSYSCRLLIDRRHRDQRMIGAFRRRTALCSKPNHSGCCKTCGQLKLLVAELANRRKHIKKPNTPITLPTIRTVNGIHLDDECNDSLLRIAGGAYHCDMLIDQNYTNQRFIGAFKHRERLCNLASQSGCCRTCTIHGLYKGNPKPKPKPSRHKTPSNKNQEKGRRKTPRYCKDTGLQIADGTYSCAMLVDKKHKKQVWLGAFKNRKRLCSGASFSGCCNTCQRHVIKRIRQPCKDEYVMVKSNKQTYACRELLHRNSDIFSDRFDLCKDTVNTRCCKTCAKVSKTKKHGTKWEENMVHKSGRDKDDEDSDDQPDETNMSDAHKAFHMMDVLLKKLNKLIGYSRKNNTPKQQELS